MEGIMSSNLNKAFEILKTLEGTDQGHGEWFQLDQERINAFADATIDHQFIHVDPERAALETPFGGSIAHGFLSLSLLVYLTTSLPVEVPRLENQIMGINYGFEKVRFINPVQANARVRAKSIISYVELKEPTAVNLTRTVTVEIEGENKPALVAEWITRAVFAS
tara:strand:+ start:227 stop:721 length:495 start_codon:yes stop_codon:yes gene_type:complete